jgi:hypothetical protein
MHQLFREINQTAQKKALGSIASIPYFWPTERLEGVKKPASSSGFCQTQTRINSRLFYAQK